MIERPPFRGSAASWVLLLWIHSATCLLAVWVAVDPSGFSELLGTTGALMFFSSPLGLAGWRFYGWRLAYASAGLGFILFWTAVLANM